MSFKNPLFDKHTETLSNKREVFVSTYFVLRIKSDTMRKYREIQD